MSSPAVLKKRSPFSIWRLTKWNRTRTSHMLKNIKEDRRPVANASMSHNSASSSSDRRIALGLQYEPYIWPSPSLLYCSPYLFFLFVNFKPARIANISFRKAQISCPPFQALENFWSRSFQFLLENYWALVFRFRLKKIETFSEAHLVVQALSCQRRCSIAKDHVNLQDHVHSAYGDENAN